MSMSRTSELPTGDRDKTTLEQGSLYADPGVGRLVRFSDPENHDGYRVELWIAEPDGSITNEMVFWSHNDVREFVELDHTEYLDGHCFDGHAPYGVYTDTGGQPCPECGTFMRAGFYYKEATAQHAGGYLPGMVCPNSYHDETTVENDCGGYMDYKTLCQKGLYIPAEEYVERRFGGDN